MQLQLLFFAFPLGVTHTTALRKPIVRFTGPEGIKRLTGRWDSGILIWTLGNIFSLIVRCVQSDRRGYR